MGGGEVARHEERVCLHGVVLDLHVRWPLPHIIAFMAMTMDQRWVLRSPEDMAEQTIALWAEERFPMVVDDLIGLPGISYQVFERASAFVSQRTHDCSDIIVNGSSRTAAPTLPTLIALMARHRAASQAQR